jgi:predicted Fe-Mo cluster-binding NifX family protein
MKVAVVTNDGEFVSQHFGRSRYYAVYTIENGQILEKELRERTVGHFDPNRNPEQESGEQHLDAQGRHGYGGDALNRHQAMAAAIPDCDALIAGGMGSGAVEAFRSAGLQVILTDIPGVEVAVTAFAEGKIQDLTAERAD